MGHYKGMKVSEWRQLMNIFKGKAMIKLAIVLAVLMVAVSAEASPKDDLKMIGISLLLDKVLKKEESKKADEPYVISEGKSLIRQYEVKQDMNRQILDRKIHNCVKRGECEREYFRF